MNANARGFSLIEVLVTVFVTAIGLLTAAGLQITTKRLNYDAQQRAQATQIAQDILSRMRANGGQLALGAYLTEDAAGTAAPGVDCASSTCTPPQMAAYDLYVWRQALLGEASTQQGENAGGLAYATGCVQAGDGGLTTIAIAWRGISPIAQGDSSNPADPSGTTCGENNPAYTAEGNEGDVTYRRVMVITAFIAAPN